MGDVPFVVNGAIAAFTFATLLSGSGMGSPIKMPDSLIKIIEWEIGGVFRPVGLVILTALVYQANHIDGDHYFKEFMIALVTSILFALGLGLWRLAEEKVTENKGKKALQADCAKVGISSDKCTQEALDKHKAEQDALKAEQDALKVHKANCVAHELAEDCDPGEITAMEAVCAGMTPAPVVCKQSILPVEEPPIEGSEEGTE